MNPSSPSDSPPVVASARNGWTDAHRRAQAARIRAWKPWENSTGPRTPAGKDQSASNASKGSMRQKLLKLSKLLRSLEGRAIPCDAHLKQERQSKAQTAKVPRCQKHSRSKT